MADYKLLKEAFVSGLTGGEISEINYVTAVGPASILLWSALQSRQAFFTAYTPLAFAIDFLLHVGAILLAMTLYSTTPVLLNALLLAPAVVLYALPAAPLRTKKPRTPTSKTPAADLDPLPLKPFLTAYRGWMMIITCLAILAVDFRLFPRRFAKVENWGTSLMDLGVGSFVFAAGVVAARPILKDQLSGRTKGLGPRLYASARHSLPLLVLGLVRLYSVKGLDYAEHVTEYGVHWNFFFTLGYLPPFVALFQSAFTYLPSYAALALLLGGAYQTALEFTSLKGFILTAARTDLFSKNREGIFSFFGYLAIFLAGQATGMYVIPRRVSSQGSASSWAQRQRLVVTLLAWSGIWIALYYACTNYTYGLRLVVSRRLANLPYFLWVAAYNCSQIAVLCVIETLFFPGSYQAADAPAAKASYDAATSRVLRAYNRNGLAVFLIANLLTGLVNLTVPTLDVSDALAMGILLGYAGLLTTVAVALDAWDVSIKL